MSSSTTGQGRLAGKVAIVTGAAMGQGAGIARAYVAEGARTVLADVAKDEGEALADSLKELEGMHRSGSLTDDEFAQAKQKLLRS